MDRGRRKGGGHEKATGKEKGRRLEGKKTGSLKKGAIRLQGGWGDRCQNSYCQSSRKKEVEKNCEKSVEGKVWILRPRDCCVKKTNAQDSQICAYYLVLIRYIERKRKRGRVENPP